MLQEICSRLISEYQCYPVFLGEELKNSYYRSTLMSFLKDWMLTPSIIREDLHLDDELVLA